MTAMALQETLVAEPPPVYVDKYGAARVCGTRIPIEAIVSVYQHGGTAEDMVRKFPSLSLPDVHAVIAYYLRYRKEVDAYIEQGRQEAEERRRQFENEFPDEAFRARVEARRNVRS